MDTARLPDALRHEPEHLLVLQLYPDGTWDEVYNRPGDTVWGLVGHKSLPKNGQYQVRCGTLQKLMESVPADRRLPRTQA